MKIKEFIIMPQSIKPMGLIHKPGTGPNNRFGFKNSGNNRANEADEFAPARALGEAETMLAYSYKMAIDHLEDRHDEANSKARVIKERIPALLDKIRNLYKTEDAAGVGIVTKQNTTKDVPAGGEYINVKKLGLSASMKSGCKKK